MSSSMLLPEIARQWRLARRLYPVYSGLRETFKLGDEPCPDLEQPIDRAEPEIIARIWGWFDEMDVKVQVHQLRQLLQSTHLATPENLSALIRRHLDKSRKTPADRDKIDFLLVQYFAHRAPQDVLEEDVTLEQVVSTLLPVLGDVPMELPSWAAQLNKALESLTQCQSLPDLLQMGILEEARWLKEGVGTAYFQPMALVLFTRFNFRVRLVFFRLMHADLHAIRQALHQLERYGVTVVDCQQANLSAQEPLATLQQICNEWKTPFRAAYSAGQNFRQILAIRAALDRALAQAIKPDTTLSTSLSALEEREFNESYSANPALVLSEAAEADQRHADAQLAGTSSPSVAEIAASALKSLEQTRQHIRAHLVKPKPETGFLKRFAAAFVTLPGKTRVSLTSWEEAAFTSDNNPVSAALENTVAARAMLGEAIDRRRRGEDDQVSSALAVAEYEIGRVAEELTNTKKLGTSDAVMNLAASARRLKDYVRRALESETSSDAGGKSSPGAARKTKRGSREK